MRVMLDTNILISAYVFKSDLMLEIIQRLADKHSLVLSSFVVEELRRVVKEKFPTKTNELEKILLETPFELVCSPQILPKHDLFSIRDKDDENVLYSAILADVDILVTGDRDLLAVEDLERPEIISHLDFLRKY